MNWVGCIPRFVKQHSGWILTGLSALGLVGTSLLVAEEAPVVSKELLQARMIKPSENPLDLDIPELTFGEKFEIAAPIYLPAFLLGAGTIACMIFNQYLNSKQQALLLAAYGLLATEYHEYRKTVQEEIGAERERELYISAQKKVKELQTEIKKLKEAAGSEKYAIATIPGIIFESTPEHIEKVFHHTLRNMLIGGELSLYDIYQFIGLPEDCYNIDDAKENGWDAYENEISNGYSAVSFEIKDVKADDGKVVHLIDFYEPPYRLGLDFGGLDCSLDNLYSGYNPDAAEQYARTYKNDGVVAFDPPDIWVQH